MRIRARACVGVSADQLPSHQGHSESAPNRIFRFDSTVFQKNPTIGLTEVLLSVAVFGPVRPGAADEDGPVSVLHRTAVS